MNAINGILRALYDALDYKNRNKIEERNQKIILGDTISLRKLGDLYKLTTDNDLINSMLNKLTIDSITHNIVQEGKRSPVISSNQELETAIDYLIESNIKYSKFLLYIILYALIQKITILMQNTKYAEIHTSKALSSSLHQEIMNVIKITSKILGLNETQNTITKSEGILIDYINILYYLIESSIPLQDNKHITKLINILDQMKLTTEVLDINNINILSAIITMLINNITIISKFQLNYIIEYIMYSKLLTKPVLYIKDTEIIYLKLINTLCNNDKSHNAIKLLINSHKFFIKSIKTNMPKILHIKINGYTLKQHLDYILKIKNL